jgi:hypothetical protein
MTILVIGSIGATLAYTQGSQLFVEEKSTPNGALLTGNVKVTQYDADGNIIAFRQTDNHIVETGMQMLMGQLFNTLNDTYTANGFPSRPLSHMAIGANGEQRLLYNNTDIVSPMTGFGLPSCARIPFDSVENSTVSGGGVSATWGPDKSPGTCVAPNCAAQMNVTASAIFPGLICGGSGETIDEAGIYLDGTVGPAEMFARNTFGSVVLNMLDTLQLDWEFTFTDNLP